MKLTNYASQLKNSVFGQSMNKCFETDLSNAGKNEPSIADFLQGKTVRYENQEKSSIVEGKTRVFKIESVESVFTAKSTGEQCVTVRAVDIDDNGEKKFRCLHMGGIELVV
jgi:hypothetical protein